MKIIASALCATLVAGSMAGVALGLNSTQAQDKYVPVFRMAVCSDPHVTPANGTLQQNLDNFFKYAYKYSDAQEYDSLDAVVVTGDLTHTGKAMEFVHFRETVTANLRKETAFMSILGNHDLYVGAEVYQSVVDQALDTHIEVNGFHLIGMSNSTTMGRFDQIDWLEEELAKAQADDPEKPIFTFQHFHITNTVFQSAAPTSDTFPSAQNSDEINAAYAQYPQVVNFSGHSHGPSLNTRSIYQKDYTLVDVTTFKDIGLGANDQILVETFFKDKAGLDNPNKATIQQAKNATSMFRIVEVDANNVVRIYTYDMYTESLAKTAASTDGDAVLMFEVDIAAGKSGFKYTDEVYKDTTAPFWTDGASVTAVGNSDGTATVTFPQAQEDDCMYGYTVTVSTDGADDIIYKFADSYFAQDNTADESFVLTGLTAGVSYTVKVTASNVWGLEGEAIETSFTA